MLVLDTNVIIYHLAGDAVVAEILITALGQHQMIIVPTIVVSEFLAFPAVTSSEIDKFNVFLSQVHVSALELPIAQLAGKLRRETKIHLADAVVSATALSYGASLVTRNVDDFKRVKNLQILKI